MTVKQAKELMIDGEIAVETMDAECRCVDYIGEDTDAFNDNKVVGMFPYNGKIYLRVEV